MVVRNTVNRTQNIKNYLLDKGTVLENFNDTASWISGSNASISADTINYLEGTKGVKAQAVTAGTLYRVDKTISYDLKYVDNFTFCFYVHDLTQLNNISVYASSNPWTSWFIYSLTNGAIKQGWNYIQISKNQFQNYNSDSFAKKILKIRFTIAPNSGVNCPVTFGAVYVNKKTLPKVIITFDDGYKTVLTNAYPYLSARGIKATSYVISATVQNTDVNYMRKSDLDILYNAGWDIGNHTKNHYSLTTLSAADQLTQIKDCRDFLLNCGYTRSANHLAYPLGTYNDSVLQQATEAGVLTARTTKNCFQSMPCENLLALSITQSDTTAKLTCARLYEAIKNGQSLFIMFHNIGSSGTNLTSIADFQYIIDFLYQLGVDFVTISEWYNGLTNPRKVAANRALRP